MRDDWCETPIFDRAQINRNNVIEGPAIIEQLDSTTLILPEWAGTIDRYGNIILKSK